ncbi:tetratricopeptide repeat protein [Parabacteroides sp. OttesenSCG-928-K15]|nr:tetratricopeptide repeat protein [Parabacteroides sp. OttesenSCG-928-K15]
MEEIRLLIQQGDIEKAIALLDHYIETDETSDEAWYLRGNAYRKLGDSRQALNNYLRAMELNPDSPAVQAHNMLIDILNFNNKDVLNP